MKIRDIQVRAVVAPLEPPIRTASGHVTQAPLLLIDLATDSGVIGRSYLFGYHAFTLAPLRELVRALVEMIKGDEVAPALESGAKRADGRWYHLEAGFRPELCRYLSIVCIHFHLSFDAAAFAQTG